MFKKLSNDICDASLYFGRASELFVTYEKGFCDCWQYAKLGMKS